MKESGRDILKRAIRELPEYVLTSEEVWLNIENELNTRQSSFADKLPEYELPRDLWSGIDQSLSTHKKKKIHLTVWKVAAMLTVLISISVVLIKFNMPGSQDSSISLSTETIDNPIPFEGLKQPGIHENSRIQMICEHNPPACASALFIDLNKQLNDINAEMIKLLEIIEQTSDPQVLRYYYQLENQKVEVELQMLRIVNQS